ncbi:aldehyde dehydrogenase family protein [Paraburkholderia acidicola]|uniref:Aldehyde dehydrogenase family protein n=1 Tax=Paraburkholderia acidicola TaxID=1912599 RepID=A0ABV1LEY5_9BURK
MNKQAQIIGETSIAVPHYPSMVHGVISNESHKEVRSPFDDALIATVEVSNRDAIERALQTAYRLFRDRDSWLSAPQRIDVLRRAAVLMSERAAELSMMIAREGGKPLVDARIEVARAIDGVTSCVELVRGSGGRVIPMGINTASANRIAYTQTEPIGVVVALSAFNHPLNLIVHQVAPAVAAGCPFIVKPASDTPLSCLTFVAILREAGLPPEWGQAVVTQTQDVATLLASDKRVGFLSFIGSGDVGWKLRSSLAPGARCALEHGGVAPVIVAADADLDAAIPRLAKGAFYHAGQVCVSVQRIFVHRSISRELVNRLGKVASELRVGDPTDVETEVGPLIRLHEVDRVDAWIQEALAAGAEKITGGYRLGTPSCYAPTVLLNPPDDCRISQQEVFGPVVCVYEYDNFDDAVRRANALPVSFQAAVFTRDYEIAMRAFSRLDASTVMLNEHTAFRTDWMPFAGLRESGLGVGGIPFTFHDMQVEKMFVGTKP